MAMVGFVIGLLVGALLGFTIMACLKVGGDDLEQYYIDLIQTYDKEVNRQYKCIKRAIEDLRIVQKDLEEAEGYYYDWLDNAIGILEGVDKE